MFHWLIAAQELARDSIQKGVTMRIDRLAILGGGNLGSAIARGMVYSGVIKPEGITITRRSSDALEALAAEGFRTTTDNKEATRSASVVVISVRPKQLDGVLEEISDVLDPAHHLVISTVTDVRIETIRERVGSQVPVIRAMPNIGVSVGESMTCLACEPETSKGACEATVAVFADLGTTQFIDEDQMTPATALCACGIAFFLRAIRAASQGGVQVGFHAEEAIRLAAQTAKGAAELILSRETHPESLIDSVTTPLGVTIAGLNEMEHRGFSSALIRGIVMSAEQACHLYCERNQDADHIR